MKTIIAAFMAVCTIGLLVGPAIANNIQSEFSVSDTLMYQQLTNSQTYNSQPAHFHRKDPTLATILSFLVVGVGQFYNGEPTKGILYLGGGIAGYTMMLVGLEDDFTYYGQHIDPDDDSGLIILGSITFLSCWISSMIDAHSSAKRINRENELRERQLKEGLSAVPLFNSNSVGTKLTYCW